MNTENRLAINDDDAKFLKNLAKTLDHQVRMIWEPAPSRRNAAVTPTHVTIIAEEQTFVDYVKFELDRHRNRVSAVARSLVAPPRSADAGECGTTAR